MNRRWNQKRYRCVCGKNARFYSHARRQWCADSQHTLCARCWQALVDSTRIRKPDNLVFPRSHAS